MRPRFKTVIVPTLIAALAILAMPVFSTDSYAHRIGRHHRHAKQVRRVMVVGTPVKMVRPVVVAGRAHGVIDFNVTPKETEVFVNGKLRGQVDDYDGYPGKLHLLPGKHKIVLRTPDGETFKRKVKVIAGHEMNLKLDLDQ